MAALAGISLLALCVGGAAVAYEEPAYDVLETFEGFELRQYAPSLVAEVERAGEFDEVGGEAFWILADYIGGENQKREKISMTAPVTQEPVGEKVGTTAGVKQVSAPSKGVFRIQFFMPRRYTLETLPEPLDPRVTIRSLPGDTVAARRYSGFWSERHYRSQEERLLGALARAGLEPSGPPAYARYNSPFSLWFLRRNGVLVPVSRSGR